MSNKKHFETKIPTSKIEIIELGTTTTIYEAISDPTISSNSLNNCIIKKTIIDESSNIVISKYYAVSPSLSDPLTYNKIWDNRDSYNYVIYNS